MKRSIGFFSVLLTLWMILLAPARGETIVLAVPGPGNLAFLPVYLAKAIAADQAEGLELKLRFFNGGPLAIRDLATNNSDFAAVGLTAIAEARADRLPVFAIGQLGQSAMFVFLLRADLKDQVKTIAQLKGRRVGTPVGTSSQRPMGQVIAEHLLENAGLRPGDVQFVPTGLNRKSQSAAFSSATVDAIMGDEPFASEMVAKGQAVILADMYPTMQSRELLGGTIVRAALATREDIYEQHPDTVKKIMRMFDRTLQWMSVHSAQETASILEGQPGFTSQQRNTLSDILQRSHGMYPINSTWDTQAVAKTEQFFRKNSTDSAASRLSFADFIRNVPGD